MWLYHVYAALFLYIHSCVCVALVVAEAALCNRGAHGSRHHLGILRAPCQSQPNNTRARLSMMRRLESGRRWALDVAGTNLPHPEKVARGGEDAFFALENDLGVFDGVGGGWAAWGQDPGVFTRGFAAAVAANVTAQREEFYAQSSGGDINGEESKMWTSTSQRDVNLSQALLHGLDQAPGKGTCTACLVTFDHKYGMLNGVNIGDSGALLVRRDTLGSPFVALRSSVQRHRFNQPYQLGTGSRDRVDDGDSFIFYVREGDIVILATDGLFDNMFDKDILQCLSGVDIKTCSAAELAQKLASSAFEISQDSKRVTPWEEEAVAAGVVQGRGVSGGYSKNGGRGWAWDMQNLGSALDRSLRRGLRPNQKGFQGKLGGVNVQENWEAGAGTVEKYRGGKTDDITVVVAVIQKTEDSLQIPPVGAVEERFADLGARKDTGPVDMHT